MLASASGQQMLLVTTHAPIPKSHPASRTELILCDHRTPTVVHYALHNGDSWFSFAARHPVDHQHPALGGGRPGEGVRSTRDGERTTTANAAEDDVKEIPRPPLPPIEVKFFTEVQGSELVSTAAAIFAFVVTDGKMGGTMDEASIFRWVPSMYSMAPSFKLNIRQNHFTGSAKKLHQEARKQKMRANISVPAFTKFGMNAHDFHDNHYEEEFEFDLNLIDDLEVELCTPAMVTDVSAKLQSLNQALPPGKVFGKIPFTVKKGERPMHRRPLCGSFTPNTTQARFAGAVRCLKKYSIFVNLTKPYLLKAFSSYKDVILAGRYLSFDGIPRDDWYWSRFEAYKTDKRSRFQDHIDDSES
ncbi:hypothetical protein LTR17_001019 [Elasticomyces elasticus]|nr:hypothetical protein LTR17_001019 [Elasticomyces elasticus]